MPLREYHRPADWTAALDWLQRSDARVAPLLLGPRIPADRFNALDVAVDLSPLDLAFIHEVADGRLEVGALTLLQDLVEAEPVRRCAAGLLAEAARLSAHPGLRQLATVAGAIRYREGPPEVLLALLALDAAVVLRGASGEREIRLHDLVAQGPAPQAEFPAAVRISCSAGDGSAILRVARTPRDEAIVAAAAVVRVEGGVCQDVRLAVAGAGVTPQRAPAAEARLQGQALTPEAAGAAAALAVAGLPFVSDFKASADYRRATAEVLARRALVAAAQGRA